MRKGVHRLLLAHDSCNSWSGVAARRRRATTAVGRGGSGRRGTAGEAGGEIFFFFELLARSSSLTARSFPRSCSSPRGRRRGQTLACASHLLFPSFRCRRRRSSSPRARRESSARRVNLVAVLLGKLWSGEAGRCWWWCRLAAEFRGRGGRRLMRGSGPDGLGRAQMGLSGPGRCSC